MTPGPSSAPTNVGMEAPTRAPTALSAPPTSTPTVYQAVVPTVHPTVPPTAHPTLHPTPTTTTGPTGLGGDGTDQGPDPDGGGGGSSEDSTSATTTDALVVSVVLVLVLVLVLLVGIEKVRRRRSRKKRTGAGPSGSGGSNVAGEDDRRRLGSVQGLLYTDLDADPVDASALARRPAPGILAHDPDLYGARAETGAIELSQLYSTPDLTDADSARYATVSAVVLVNETGLWHGDAAAGRSPARTTGATASRARQHVDGEDTLAPASLRGYAESYATALDVNLALGPAFTTLSLGSAPVGESESDAAVPPRQHPRGYGIPQDKALGHTPGTNGDGTAAGSIPTGGPSDYATATDAKAVLASAASHAYGNAGSKGDEAAEGNGATIPIGDYATATDAKAVLASAASHAYRNAGIKGEGGVVADPEAAYSTALQHLHVHGPPGGAPAAAIVPGHEYAHVADDHRTRGAPRRGLDHGQGGYADPAVIKASMIGHDYRATVPQAPAAPGVDRGTDHGSRHTGAYADPSDAVIKAAMIGHDYRATAPQAPAAPGVDLRYESVPKVNQGPRPGTAVEVAEHLYADVDDRYLPGEQPGGASGAASAGPTIIYDALGGDGDGPPSASSSPDPAAIYSVVTKGKRQ